MHDQQSNVRVPSWLDSAPIACLALDSAGKIQWVNPELAKWVGLRESELIGHDKDSLPSPTHRVLLGSEALICLHGPDGAERWLRCTRARQEQDPLLMLCFYQDVTREIALEQENAKLRAQVEELQLVDELTGLPNRKALRQSLELHVSRSRRYANPLSVILVRLAGVPDDARLAPSVLATARYLRDRLRWVDQIARWDDQSFLVVLPETGEIEAKEVERNLRAQRDNLKLAREFGASAVNFLCAGASWQRGDDAHTLLRRTEQALGEAGSTSSSA